MSNPYSRLVGRWYFYDELDVEHGPFDTEQEALRALLMYMNPEHYSWVDMLWAEIKRFFCDTRGSNTRP